MDKLGRREIILNTNKNTYKFDIKRNIIYENEKKTLFKLDKNDTYKDMHLDILNNNGKNACRFEDSFKCLELIDKIQEC